MDRKDLKAKAKREMLDSLKKEMTGMMNDGVGKHLKGMKKVTVASDSDEGLEKGLSKAEEILKMRGLMPEEEKEMEDMEDMEDMEELEDMEEMDSEDEDSDPEEKIAELEAKLKELKEKMS